VSTTGKIHVIGIGSDGLAGLTNRSQELLTQAELVLGSEPVLRLLPEINAERFRIGSDLQELVEKIQSHIDKKRMVIVASGDPLQDRVILWTRITPARFEDEVEVRWRVARDPRMRREVCKGSFKTDIRRDFTVKVDVQDLEPGSTYYYRFESRGGRSPVGRTKTLPQGRVEAARIAFASCSNFPFGHFNAYARIAERADLDLVLHLGNYIYE